MNHTTVCAVDYIWHERGTGTGMHTPSAEILIERILYICCGPSARVACTGPHNLSVLSSLLYFELYTRGRDFDPTFMWYLRRFYH